MNGKSFIIVCTSVVLAGIIAGGCITSSYESTLLRRYQQQMTRAIADGAVTGRIIASPAELRSAALDGAFAPVQTKTDPDTGRARVELTLADAVHRAIANNPAVMIAAFDPALSREELTSAEAEFDAVFQASINFAKTDAQSNYPSVIGRNKTSVFSTSLSQRYLTGAQASITYSLERTRTYNPTYWNDPNYASKTAIELTQPLLRDFGPEVNSAKMRVARINYDISMETFRAQLLATIEEVQGLYWRLVQARQDVDIQKRQLARTRKTLEQVIGRSRLDASKVQITNAQSVAESSNLTLIRAERLVGDVQGRLIKAIGDPSLQLLGEFDLVPISSMTDAPIDFDPAAQLATALKYNPDLEQVRRSVEIQNIAVRVADNQTLPRLDLKLGTAFNGAVSDNAKDSWDQMAGGDYIDYSGALEYAWPIGNRQKLSDLRRAKYSRAKSLATLQDTADQLAVAITEAARLVNFTHREIVASRDALKAYMDNLDALEARRETVEALTPDFLNRLLQAQENVASAERAAIQAMVTYNTALASLERLTGTALNDKGVIIMDNGDDVLELMDAYLTLSGEKESRIPVEPEDRTDTPDASKTDAPAVKAPDIY